MGRKTRTVPPAVRRALDHRDGGCRFPGCANRFCDAHHVRHWADGGETRLSNLLLLCRFHHRAVHEGGYRVEMVEGAPRFRAPNGRHLPDVPEAPAFRSDEEAGLTLGPWTSAPHWTAARLDLDWAVTVPRSA